MMLTPFDYWLPQRKVASDPVNFELIFENLLNRHQRRGPEITSHRLKLLRSRKIWTTTEFAKALNITIESAYSWLHCREGREVACVIRGKSIRGHPSRWQILLPKK